MIPDTSHAFYALVHFMIAFVSKSNGPFLALFIVVESTRMDVIHAVVTITITNRGSESRVTNDCRGTRNGKWQQEDGRVEEV